MSEPLTCELIVRAPGKAMLFGEYAVLEGAPALVAAVDRYATAQAVPNQGLTDSPFVREARAAALVEMTRRGLKPRLTGLRIDSAPLYANGARGRKLGLGSSAAVTVAAFGEWPDLPRETVWQRCQEAHCKAQGTRGSGADIAAAIWGGVIRFQSRGDSCDVQPIALQPDLAITLVDTGVAASTASRLDRLFALQRSEPARHAALLAPLHRLAREVARRAESHGSIDHEAVRAWNRALDELGAAIDLPIMTDAHYAIAAAAQAAGGSAKPSGAGGGDLAVCFTPREATAELGARLLDRGFAPLAIAVGARGLHTVHPDREPAHEHAAPKAQP